MGFLPGLVLAMIRLFPTREIGLEIACVVMIFTAQVWNMTFSFHGSLRGIPQPLREVAAIQRLSGWQTFRLLEVPAAMIGLVWNSMMSMAGGWFFLPSMKRSRWATRDYRLPGIGSYMNEAINQSQTSRRMIAAIVAMIIMIVAVDQIFWRPIVVWAQRFRMDDIAQADVRNRGCSTCSARAGFICELGELFGRKHKKPIARRSRSRCRPSRPAVAAPQSTGSLNVTKPPRPTWQAGMIVRSTVVEMVCSAPACSRAVWGSMGVDSAAGRLAAVGSAPRKGGNPSPNMRTGCRLCCALLASFRAHDGGRGAGAAWALPVGIMIGLSPKWSSRLQPIIQVVASFPAPMLFPLVTMVLVFLHVPFTAGCVALMLLGRSGTSCST